MNKLENRIPPPILMVLVAIIMYFIAIITPTIYISNLTRWGLTAFLVILAGFFGPPAFKTFLMANTTTDPINIDKTSTLVTWGVYRYSRNPMYLSLTLLLCAWNIWLARPIFITGPILFVIFISRFQIIPEELILLEHYGSQYSDYKKLVRRWL